MGHYDCKGCGHRDCTCPRRTAVEIAAAKEAENNMFVVDENFRITTYGKYVVDYNERHKSKNKLNLPSYLFDNVEKHKTIEEAQVAAKLRIEAAYATVKQQIVEKTARAAELEAMILAEVWKTK